MRKYWILGLVFLIGACSSGGDEVAYPQAKEGLETKIRYYAQALEQKVTKVDGPLVTIKTTYEGETVWIRNMYRGLFAISSNIFDMEFDYDQLDELFPLAVGKVISFPAITIFKDDNTVAETQVHIAVTQRNSLIIGGETVSVFVIEIVHEYQTDKDSSLAHKTIHYAPKYGIVVKEIVNQEGQQPVFWSVTDISEDPTNDGSERRRQGGTLLI